MDTQAGGSSSSPDNLSASYRSDDLVATLSQGAACEGFTYDPSGDVVSTSNYATSSCTGTPTTTSTNDYAGSSSPAWTTTTVGSTTSTTAYFAAITQGDALNVTLASSGGSSCLGITTATCTMNLTDLRGNVIATASLTSDTSVTGYSESTEFGLPRSASTESTVAPVYGWLGTHEKAANNLSGLVVMVVRIYNPVTGLFTSPDPVYQGNANPYVYPSDPVNGMDLSGEKGSPIPAACAEMLSSCRAAMKSWKKRIDGVEQNPFGPLLKRLGRAATTVGRGLLKAGTILSCVANSYWPTSPSLAGAGATVGAGTLRSGVFIVTNVGEIDGVITASIVSVAGPRKLSH